MAKKGKFKFFALCAEEQDLISEELGAYDNNLDVERIPKKVKEAYCNDPELPEWYKEFIRNKFFYFSLLLKDIDSADLEIKERLGSNAGLRASIVDRWRNQADREKIVYISRISQIPKNIVISYWYNDLPEFLEWARLCEDIVQVRQYFDPPPQDKLEAIVHAPIVHRITDELSVRFFTLLGQWIFEEQYYIQAFLGTLRAEFRCDLCDYLEVQGERVVLCATTVDLEAMARTLETKTEEQLRRELAENQSYLKGEGISGCILLCPGPDCRWFHVGTNNLADDLRKSVKKEELYETLYSSSLKAGGGRIYNFWMFPIFAGNRLVAAFRVVNRHDESAGSLPARGWPSSEKLQLCAVAQSFSKLWMALKSLPEMRRPDLATQIKQTSDFISEVAKQLDLQWMSEQTLAELMDHLITVVQQRIEERAIGCSLVVVEESSMRSFLETFHEDTGVKVNKVAQLSELTRFYDQFEPEERAFVLNQEDDFVRLVKIEKQLQGQVTSDTDPPIAATTRFWNSVGFLVRRGVESILIYRKGALVAEYFLYRRIGQGRWKIRYLAPTLETVCMTIKHIQRPVIEQVFWEAWRISYSNPNRRQGAKIIIADEKKISECFAFEEKGDRLEVRESIFSLSSRRFSDFAKKDGSILLSPDGIIYKVGYFLKPRNPILLPADWRSLLDREERGSRHRSAAEECCVCREALVFVVSQDRGISILFDGAAIKWDF